MGNKTKDIQFLLSFAPEWTDTVEEGLDPTFYGTGSYKNDLIIKERIDKIKRSINNSDYIEIPEGYLWCMDCDALTPHKKLDDTRFSWQEDYRSCVICERTIEFDQEDCPKCGWRYMNYEDPPVNTVQVHHPGCHYNEASIDEDDIMYSLDYSHAEDIWDVFIRHNPQFKNVKEITCNCPEYIIYPDPYCYASTGGYGHGMDCFDHQWWCLSIRCPICGERFEIEDENC